MISIPRFTTKVNNVNKAVCENKKWRKSFSLFIVFVANALPIAVKSEIGGFSIHDFNDKHFWCSSRKKSVR